VVVIQRFSLLLIFHTERQCKQLYCRHASDAMIINLLTYLLTSYAAETMMTTWRQ